MQIEIKNRPKTRPGFTDLLLSWLINSAGLFVISRMFKGIEFRGEGMQGALLVLASGAVLGLINTAIKPFLLILTLPINILSLGFFTFVINAGCLGLVAYVVPGFRVEGFWPALGGAFMLSMVSILLNAVVALGGFKVRISK
jgi:putative membrane protein